MSTPTPSVESYFGQTVPWIGVTTFVVWFSISTALLSNLIQTQLSHSQTYGVVFIGLLLALFGTAVEASLLKQ